MLHQLELLLGLAGTGKTRHLLERYRRFLRTAHENRHCGSTVWLAPTRKACRAIERNLLATDLAVCSRPQVMTFEDFAEKILIHAVLSRSVDHNLPISNLERRWIFRQLLDRLLADGQLPHFSVVSKTTGFLDLVIEFVVELKREELWPESFQEICRRRGERPADRELGLIYAEYQRLLQKCQRYDAEGRFWLARSLVLDGHWQPFDRLDLVIVDGFTDFTSPQHEILEALIRHSEQTAISLPFDPDDERQDLFSKSQGTYQRLQELKKRDVTIHESVLKLAVTETPLSIQDLFAKSLFAITRTLEPASSMASIEIVETLGPQSELQLIAERVKTLLRTGVPAKDIVVSYRSLSDSAERLRDVFDAAEIPCDSELEETCERHPLLKSLVALLQLEVEDWPFDRLTFLVGSSHFRPLWQSWNPDTSPRIIARQLRRRKLSGERLAILHGLAQAARQYEQREPRRRDSADAIEVQQTLEWLNRLSETLDLLRTPTTLSGWIDRLVTLVQKLGFTRSVAPTQNDATAEHDRHDLATWEYIKRILYDLVPYEEIFADTATASEKTTSKKGHRKSEVAKRLALADFLLYLNDLFRSTPLLTTKSATSSVRILSAQSVRHLEVPYLFLPGMNEGSFPNQRRENCLYGEQERAQLRQLGVPFSIMQMHRHDEMNLFYSVVTRVRKELVLSYSSVDSAGQPLYPSPYVTAVKELFREDSRRVRTYGRLDPIPDAAHVLTDADLRIRAVADVYNRKGGLFRAVWERQTSRPIATNILASAEMAARRRKKPFSTYEGMLREPQSHEFLRKTYPADHEYSATELEEYATCPFRFFLKSILHVEPLESPEPETNHLRRGIVVHSILSTLLREARDEQQAPREWQAKAIAKRFHELVGAKLGQRLSEGRLHESINRIEQMLLDEWGTLYSTQWHDYFKAFGQAWDIPPTPEAFEIAFGRVPEESSAESAPANVFPSLKIGKGKQTLSVRGRIDRIDVGETGDVKVFNVIDYKTGKPPRFNQEDVNSGRALQLLLYALAVQRLGMVGPDAKPFQMVYWSIKNEGYALGMTGQGKKANCKPVDVAVWESLVTLLELRLPQLVNLMQIGQFPVYNADPQCTGLCDYRTVCRIHQVRSHGKVWHPVNATANLPEERSATGGATT
ncbi:MAG: PD-(D/E)XK nuclease family protein [Planctomycetota bacterium]|nr:PD-(D/E)XK nuclease family protein [Planctomycetota bacterium]